LLFISSFLSLSYLVRYMYQFSKGTALVKSIQVRDIHNVANVWFKRMRVLSSPFNVSLE